MPNAISFAPIHIKYVAEPSVEAQAEKLLSSPKFGFEVFFRKCGIHDIDKHWPSKNAKLPSGEVKAGGAPDLLLAIKGTKKPVCVWENKSRTVPATDALRDAQFYVRELHRSPARHTPALPRLAAGFNGQELLLSYFNADEIWVPIKIDGTILKDGFVPSKSLLNGISSQGTLNAILGPATVQDLRGLLPRLKTIYRNIPTLTTEQGRTPIDFTVAMLTLRLLVEQHPEWGSWAEQPALQSGNDKEQRIAQRFKNLVDQIEHDTSLRDRYGKILKFADEENGKGFDFVKVIDSIPRHQHHFTEIFEAFDGLPPLLNADFDLFGEVYQAIGDKATKKALGEFFTGRHIIAGVLPIFFSRSGLGNSFASLSKKKIADIACGTGGFLTETLRLAKRTFNPKQQALKNFAMHSFYGFDLGTTNASRARVNMYFAGDGFSAIVGGVDALATEFEKRVPASGFDAILTNPPYGQSSYGRTEEAFVRRTLESLRDGTGWGLLVLPTGILENPRSAGLRFDLLRAATITDIIELPKHAFAPYTLQKTSVIVFRKRSKPIGVATGDWMTLTSLIGQEEIALFIVDNDGYANSDKRYPTDKRDESGRWLHNDLAEWIDPEGIKRPSAAYDACINRVSPVRGKDDGFENNEIQYSTKRLLELTDPEQGIVLLPTAILRRSSSSLPFGDFIKSGTELVKLLKKPLSDLPEHWLSQVEALLSSTISYEISVPTMQARVDEMFEVRKGDPGLTEELIYRASDPNGIKVYGGGISEPKFRVGKDALTKKGDKVTIFSGPKIVVAMDGTAGVMKVVDDAEFCLNHHAAVLVPYDKTLDLHWFIQQAQSGVRNLASNQESSATLTKPGLEAYEVTVPLGMSPRRSIGDLRRGLLKLQRAI